MAKTTTNKSKTEIQDTEEAVVSSVPEFSEDINIVQEEPKELSEFEILLQSYNYDYSKALFEYCFHHNIFYNHYLVDQLIQNIESYKDKIADLGQIYYDTVQADFRFEGKTFFEQIKQENFEKLYGSELDTMLLSEEDKKNRQVVIDIFAYDPFKDESVGDRPQLYRDLAGMTTESMRKDVAKQKAALSIVRSYQNIEKYQRKVTELTSSGTVNDDTQKTLDQYLKVISTIQGTINQTAEKNNFTVKGIGLNGRGMLSDVMNQVEDMGIDEGITNFYDIATSKSIEEVANISWKAELNQLNLSKTDYVDILSNQVVIVREAQATAADALEALRLAKEKITKQELLQELEKDYKRKGISEEEIKEFIKREFNLYDGVD